MWLADSWKDYEVLDTSAGEKLERWGKYILVRPDPQVIWNTPKDDPLWRKTGDFMMKIDRLRALKYRRRKVAESAPARTVAGAL